MTETPAVYLQTFDYYNFCVTGNFVFEYEKPPISSSYEYEENGVYYCTTGTEQGVYWYIYCLNNPLKYTDPSGQWLLDSDDIWDFDEEGNFIGRIRTTEFDQIRIWDKDRTQVLAESNKFPYKTITEHKRPFDMILGVQVRLDIFRIKGNDNAKEIFQMFAENTFGYNDKGDWKNLEWSLTKIGFESSESNIVGTSHKTDMNVVGKYLSNNKYFLREHTHNHPGYHPLNYRPSGEVLHDVDGKIIGRTYDLHTAELYQKQFPHIKLNIYTSRYGYSPYDKDGTLRNALIINPK